MIGLSGAIGTGIFVTSGEVLDLVKFGPTAILVAYTFCGLILYSVMESLGEMISILPVSPKFLVLPDQTATYWKISLLSMLLGMLHTIYSHIGPQAYY
jgi:amino acid permease